MSDSEPLRDTLMMKIGAISALTWVALQVIGNILHPRLPADFVISMQQIAASEVWLVAHLILLFDYVVLIPMIIGFTASFAEKQWELQIGVPLVVVAVSAGMVQVALHPTALKVLAEQYVTANDLATQTYILTLYAAVWKYNVALEVGHLLVIHVVVILVAAAMLRDAFYPKWVAVLGMIGGLVAAVSLLVGELFLESSVLGDALTFGIGLAPSAAWLVIVAFLLLRYQQP
jgi:hypothetical protein